MKAQLKRFFSGLSINTYLLTFASLFADIATEMLYPVLPIYLTQVLKANGSIVGLIEGVATATQNIVQGFSGWISDKLGRRKKIALAGYIIAASSKPLIGFSANWEQVLGARFLDRFGTGTRSAPRDALIAASADEKNRGKAFGLEGIGDNMGAFLGPLLAIYLIFTLHINLRSIFFIAIIPGFLAVIMILLVSEKISDFSKKKIDITLKHFPGQYWMYLLVTLIFGIGNSTNAFLILQTRSIGVSLQSTIFIYAIFNLVAAVSSYPSGFLSDKVGRKNVLIGSFLIFILVYLGFAFTRNVLFICSLFLLYGIYQGTFRAVGKAFASDFVSEDLRASSIGWYSTAVGMSGLLASVVAGFLWDKVSHPAVFIYGLTFALLGTITLIIVIKPKK